MCPASSRASPISSSSTPTRTPIRPRPGRWRPSAPPRTTTCGSIPIPRRRRLRETLAAYHGVGLENVFVGNGSDEVLAHAFAALLKHDKPLLFPDVTYSFYPVYAQLTGVACETVPLDADMRVSVADYRRPCGAIILANPNAPTGIALPLAAIAALVEEHRRHSRRDRRGLCRFRRQRARCPGRAPSQSSRRAHVVEIAGAGGPAGRLCDGRRRADRGAGAGQGQLQFLSARRDVPGGRARLRRGRGLFPGAA